MGAPTCPMLLSPGSVRLITHADSVMPYPSSTTGKTARRKRKTSREMGEAPETRRRTRPPSRARTLEKTTLRFYFDFFFD